MPRSQNRDFVLGVVFGFVASTVVTVVLYCLLGPTPSQAGSQSVAPGPSPALERTGDPRTPLVVPRPGVVPRGVVEVAQALTRDHVDRIAAAPVFEACMKAMASGFDRHGYYATGHERAQLERMRERGLGLGVVLAPIRHGDRTQVEIVRVRPGSRAEDAGLGEGDQVLEIGDQTTVDLRRGIDIERRLAELADRRGSPTVPMTVRPRGRLQPNRVQLPWTRTLPEASVQGRLLEASGRTVFWLHINEFVRGTGHAFEGELERLRVTAGTHQPLGLVLDLRGNPGGNIDEALIVADAFLSSGVITTTRGREGRILREERAHRVTAEPDLAMVVLQDEYTASAAELLAMALRDHKRAALVGTRTFGKGTVQELRGLADGGLLALTIARYHGPAGEMIDGVGVAPDAAVHVHSSMAHRPGIGRFPRALPRSGEAVEGWKSDITLFRGIQMLMPGQGIDRK